MAGVSNWLVAVPPDVIKSRFQTAPARPDPTPTRPRRGPTGRFRHRPLQTQQRNLQQSLRFAATVGGNGRRNPPIRYPPIVLAAVSSALVGLSSDAHGQQGKRPMLYCAPCNAQPHNAISTRSIVMAQAGRYPGGLVPVLTGVLKGY
jgi:hypothetical protein